MGSKGSNTTRSVQSYAPNQAVYGPMSQAISMATNAANQPFQMPVAPVAGFNQDQEQGFQQYRDMQGMAQPYFNTASNLAMQSASPISGQDISQYYNPFAQNVFTNLREDQGRQMSDMTGRLTQAAGGIGADRIGVGQAELARQQNLATGKVAADLYQPALAAAQQDRGRQGAAAYAMGSFGPAAQNSYLQGTQALTGAGGLQQQLAQARLNAPYQQELARIAYPFQTAQYLAGITGGLAPAFGGTTTGQTTGPKPNTTAQWLGAGLSVLGMLGGLGPGLSGLYGGGGRVGYADGGNVDDTFPPVPGASIPRTGGLAPIPYIRLPFGLSGERPFRPPAAPSDSGGFNASKSIRSGLDSVRLGREIRGIFAADGGAISSGGAVLPYEAFAGYADGGIPTFNDRYAPAQEAITAGIFDPQGINATPFANIPVSTQASTPYMPMTQPASYAPQLQTVVPHPLPPQQPQQAQPPSATGGQPLFNPDMGTPETYGGLKQPYPSAEGQSDIGQKFARSPWEALVAAGAGMMASKSPFLGTAVGEGIQSGLSALQGQRKELREEEAINQRVRQLEKEYKFHLDQYQRQKPSEVVESLKPFKIGMDPVTYQDIYGIRDPRTGEIKRIDPSTGKTIEAGTEESSAQKVEMSGDEYLNSLPSERRALLEKIANGEIAPPSGAALRSPRTLAILQQVARAYPGFDATVWKSRNETRAAFSKGVEARSVTSLNTIMGHLNDLKDTAVKLSQHSLTPWNKIENAVRDRLGKEAYADYQFTRTAVSDELARVFQGVGVTAEAEKERWLSALDDARSPAQFRKILGRAASLIQSRMDALAGQYNRGMNLPPDKGRNGIDFLDPEPKKKFENLKKWSTEPLTALPPGVPEGSQPNLNKKSPRKWKSPDGRFFDSNGKEVQ